MHFTTILKIYNNNNNNNNKPELLMWFLLCLKHVQDWVPLCHQCQIGGLTWVKLLFPHLLMEGVHFLTGLQWGLNEILSLVKYLAQSLAHRRCSINVGSLYLIFVYPKQKVSQSVSKKDLLGEKKGLQWVCEAMVSYMQTPRQKKKEVLFWGKEEVKGKGCNNHRVPFTVGLLQQT